MAGRADPVSGATGSYGSAVEATSPAQPSTRHRPRWYRALLRIMSTGSGRRQTGRSRSPRRSALPWRTRISRRSIPSATAMAASGECSCPSCWPPRDMSRYRCLASWKPTGRATTRRFAWRSRSSISCPSPYSCAMRSRPARGGPRPSTAAYRPCPPVGATQRAGRASDFPGVTAQPTGCFIFSLPPRRHDRRRRPPPGRQHPSGEPRGDSADQGWLARGEDGLAAEPGICLPRSSCRDSRRRGIAKHRHYSPCPNRPFHNIRSAAYGA